MLILIVLGNNVRGFLGKKQEQCLGLPGVQLLLWKLDEILFITI